VMLLGGHLVLTLHAVRPATVYNGRRRQSRGRRVFRPHVQAHSRQRDGDLGGVLGESAALLGVAAFRQCAAERVSTSYLLDSIAAVVVGGTSLFGGRGGNSATPSSAWFVLGVLNNGLDHVNNRQFSEDIDPWPDPARRA